MKIFAVLLLVGLLYITCAKEMVQDDDTRLLIKLEDSLGNVLGGVPVKLYKHAADTGLTQVTDSTGRTLFSNLEPVMYYWLAEIGCRNNLADKFTMGRPLVRGSVLYGTSVIRATGVLVITNLSGQPYRVTDSSLFNIVLNDTPYVVYRKADSIRIYSERHNMPATKKDTVFTIHCGDTSYLSLPF